MSVDAADKKLPATLPLTAEQKRQFQEEGYLLVTGLLDPERDIQPVLDEYNGVLDGLAQGLVAEGKLGSTHAELPFADRLIAVCEESGPTAVPSCLGSPSSVPAPACAGPGRSRPCTPSTSRRLRPSSTRCAP